MEEFRIIYRFLEALRGMLGNKKYDMSVISPEAMKTTREKLNDLCIIMLQAGLVENIKFQINNQCCNGYYEYEKLEIMWTVSRPQITLKGLEYLAKNSMMKKQRKHEMLNAKAMIENCCCQTNTDIDHEKPTTHFGNQDSTLSPIEKAVKQYNIAHIEAENQFNRTIMGLCEDAEKE